MSEKALLRLADALGIQFGTADEIVDAAIKRIGPRSKFKIGECVRVIANAPDSGVLPYHGFEIGSVGVIKSIEIDTDGISHCVAVQGVSYSQWVRERDLEKVC